MYAVGRGVPQDETEAVRWFRLAAEQGYRAAQYNLGRAYENGLGVPQDYVGGSHVARPCRAAVFRDGRDFYGEFRDDVVAARMTPEQIAEAQRLAREWKPTVNRKAGHPAPIPTREAPSASQAGVARYSVVKEQGLWA